MHGTLFKQESKNSYCHFMPVLFQLFIFVQLNWPVTSSTEENQILDKIYRKVQGLPGKQFLPLSMSCCITNSVAVGHISSSRQETNLQFLRQLVHDKSRSSSNSILKAAMQHNPRGIKPANSCPWALQTHSSTFSPSKHYIVFHDFSYYLWRHPLSSFPFVTFSAAKTTRTAHPATRKDSEKCFPPHHTHLVLLGESHLGKQRASLPLWQEDEVFSFWHSGEFNSQAANLWSLLSPNHSCVAYSATFALVKIGS